MHILGINAYHGDSSTCLVRDGTLIAAAEEERFRRIKHWAGLPTEAIAYCLSEAGINLGGGTCATNSCAIRTGRAWHTPWKSACLLWTWRCCALSRQCSLVP